MKRAILPLLVLSASCATAPRPETIPVPGTDLAFEMIPIPAVPHPVLISRTEVTWRQFDRFYEFPEEETVDGVTRPSAGKNYLGLSGLPNAFMESDRPVTNLRIHSALVFCEWLSRKTGRVFRLPTEKEWEAARGTQGPRHPSEGTSPVATAPPNALGIHDLDGNAWEYCLELDDGKPVLRSGAWNAVEDRITPPAAWSEADPSRPFSVW